MSEMRRRQGPSEADLAAEADLVAPNGTQPPNYAVVEGYATSPPSTPRPSAPAAGAAVDAWQWHPTYPYEDKSKHRVDAITRAEAAEIRKRAQDFKYGVTYREEFGSASRKMSWLAWFFFIGFFALSAFGILFSIALAKDLNAQTHLGSMKFAFPVAGFVFSALSASLFYGIVFNHTEEKLQVLLVGQMNAGKSTLINNINYVLSRTEDGKSMADYKIAEEQAASGTAGQGTRKYHKYTLGRNLRPSNGIEVYDGVGMTAFNVEEDGELRRVINHGVAHNYRPDFARHAKHEESALAVGHFVQIDVYLFVLSYEQVMLLGDPAYKPKKQFENVNRDVVVKSLRRMLGMLKGQHANGLKPPVCVTGMDTVAFAEGENPTKERFVKLAEKVLDMPPSQIKFIASYTQKNEAVAPKADPMKDRCTLLLLEDVLRRGNRAIVQATFSSILAKAIGKALHPLRNLAVVIVLIAAVLYSVLQMN